MVEIYKYHSFSIHVHVEQNKAGVIKPPKTPNTKPKYMYMYIHDNTVHMYTCIVPTELILSSL